MSCLVSAEVARARDAGNLISLVVQGQSLQVGTTLYRTAGPSENLTTNADIAHKHSNLSTQFEGSPALRTLESRGVQVWGRGRVGRAPFTARVAGLQAPKRCGDSRVTALDAVSAGAPPGPSHAQATTEWAGMMSNQEGAARWPWGTGACRADFRSGGLEWDLQS